MKKCKVIVAQVRMDTAMPGRGSGLMAWKELRKSVDKHFVWPRLKTRSLRDRLDTSRFNSPKVVKTTSNWPKNMKMPKQIFNPNRSKLHGNPISTTPKLSKSRRWTKSFKMLQMTSATCTKSLNSECRSSKMSLTWESLKFKSWKRRENKKMTTLKCMN